MARIEIGMLECFDSQAISKAQMAKLQEKEGGNRPGNNSQFSCSLARLPKNFCEKICYFKGENTKF